MTDFFRASDHSGQIWLQRYHRRSLGNSHKVIWACTRSELRSHDQNSIPIHPTRVCNLLPIHAACATHSAVHQNSRGEIARYWPGLRPSLARIGSTEKLRYIMPYTKSRSNSLMYLPFSDSSTQYSLRTRQLLHSSSDQLVRTEPLFPASQTP